MCGEQLKASGAIGEWTMISHRAGRGEPLQEVELILLREVLQLLPGTLPNAE